MELQMFSVRRVLEVFRDFFAGFQGLTVCTQTGNVVTRTVKFAGSPARQSRKSLFYRLFCSPKGIAVERKA
jgi:hypothetical protein